MTLLAVWLILWGLLTGPAPGITFAHSANILAIFAIVVGVLLRMGRQDGYFVPGRRSRSGWTPLARPRIYPR